MGIALIATAIAMGSTIQRVTGIGFTIIALPFTVLVLGIVEGVLFLNIVGIALCLLASIDGRRDLDPRLILKWGLVGALAVVPGAHVISVIPQRPAFISLSFLLFGAMLVAFKEISPKKGLPQKGSAVSGLAAGFLTGFAALPGPPLVMNAVRSGMPPATFVSTAQPVYLILASIASATKLVRSEGGSQIILDHRIVIGFGAVVIGIAVGRYVKRLFPDTVLLRFAKYLCFLSACVLFIQGLFEF